MTTAETRKHIENSLKDLAINLLYYDRKGDNELPVGAIQQAVKDGTISVDEMAAIFRESLVGGIAE